MYAARPLGRQLRRIAYLLIAAAVVFTVALQPATAAAPIDLSNIPMVLGETASPQVLFLLGNSQSMDGDLGGAIMTGATGPYATYTVPSGFDPPMTPSATGTIADTYTTGGVEYDNSASRLNVAKEAIKQTVQAYITHTEFGLMDYDTGGSPSLYNTWVYYMSAGNDSSADQFGFTNTAAGNSTETATVGTATAPNTYPNPCYEQTASTSPACQDIATLLGTGSSTYDDKYLQAGISSDSPNINDVLYASGFPSEFVSYDGPWANKSGGTPVSYSLSAYNNNNVIEWYTNTTDTGKPFATGPTNAGYLSDSYQVWYAKRGFGYYNADTGSGALVLKVQTAANQPLSKWWKAPTATDPLPSGPLAAETNNPSSLEIKAQAAQSPIAGLVKSAGDYFAGNYSGYPAPPATGGAGCTPQRYTVLLTDGLPTEDLSGKLWPPLGSTAATEYGVYATFDLKSGGTISTSDPTALATAVNNNNIKSLDVSATNDQAAIDAVTEIQDLQAQNPSIETYVVGLGAGVDPTKNPAAAALLDAMAQAGGTDHYFAATTVSDMATDLRTILGQIQAKNVAAGNTTGNSPYLMDLNQVFQTRFTADDQSHEPPYDDWTGNLYSLKVDGDGSVNTDLADANWDAQSQLDGRAATSRRIVTWNPSANSGAGGGVPFEATATTSTLTDKFSTTQNADLAATGYSDPEIAAAVDYLRGDQSNEGTGYGFRQRTHILGDIVNSSPIYVGAPFGPYTDTSYIDFERAERNREPMIYVGANDGMLHAFTASLSGGGKESWAFIPNGVFDHLINLTEPDYNASHRFYVDGTPTAGDVQFSDNTWHTVLVGGLRDGGKSIYALDITNPPASTATEADIAQNVLWEFTDSNMGQSYSRPMIARLYDPATATGSPSEPQFVVVFGSGYNNSDQQPYLYFVNAQTGVLVKKMNLCSYDVADCNTSLPNGLSTPVVVAPNGDGIVTTVYAGDLQGNLWKLDVSNHNPSKWTASVLFKATGPSGNPQPITTAPVVSLQPDYPAKQGYMVYFGTGKYLGADDIPNGTTTPQTQSFYGIWDNGSTTDLRRTELQSQTLTSAKYTNSNTGATETVLLATSNPIDWSHQYGWYMDLDIPSGGGAMVARDPILAEGRVEFTFFVPPGTDGSNVCGNPGESYLMVLNYATGGAFQNPELDLNGDNALNSGDKVKVNGQEQNPVGVDVGSGMSSSVLETRKTTPGADHSSKNTLSSGGGDFHLNERGGPAGRMSWRQIR